MLNTQSKRMDLGLVFSRLLIKVFPSCNRHSEMRYSWALTQGISRPVSLLRGGQSLVAGSAVIQPIWKDLTVPAASSSQRSQPPTFYYHWYVESRSNLLYIWDSWGLFSRKSCQERYKNSGSLRHIYLFIYLNGMELGCLQWLFW